MSSLMGIAAASVSAGMARYDQSASDVVKAAMPDSKTDLATAMVRETTNSVAAKADIAVFKMADQTMGALLDVKA